MTKKYVRAEDLPDFDDALYLDSEEAVTTYLIDMKLMMQVFLLLLSAPLPARVT